MKHRVGHTPGTTHTHTTFDVDRRHTLMYINDRRLVHVLLNIHSAVDNGENAWHSLFVDQQMCGQ